MQDDETQVISISFPLSEWHRLIDLIDIAAEELDNKVLSAKLRYTASRFFGNIAEIGSFKVKED